MNHKSMYEVFMDKCLQHNEDKTGACVNTMLIYSINVRNLVKKGWTEYETHVVVHLEVHQYYCILWYETVYIYILTLFEVV